LAQSPGNRRILFELGATLERLGERGEAMTLLRKLVKFDTANAVALNYLGYMLVEDNRDLDYAGRLIDRALRLEPENGAYLDSKGW
jgi:Flp pilus assembly protein TadD